MVRYVGYSNWTAWQAAKALGIQEKHAWQRFSVAQMYYSLIGRDLEHEVLPFARDAGIGTMIWSPLAGGLLSGKYTRESLSDKNNRLAGFDFLPEDKDWALGVVEKVRDLAKQKNVSVAQLSLAWLLHKPEVSTVLVGSSKLSQLEDNLAAADLTLSTEDLKYLDALAAPLPLYPNWFQTKTADAMLAQVLAGT